MTDKNFSIWSLHLKRSRLLDWRAFATGSSIPEYLAIITVHMINVGYIPHSFCTRWNEIYLVCKIDEKPLQLIWNKIMKRHTVHSRLYITLLTNERMEWNKNNSHTYGHAWTVYCSMFIKFHSWFIFICMIHFLE